jgi:hypothetical protein
VTILEGGWCGIQLQPQDRGGYLTGVAAKGVWLLPAFGLLMACSTIREQQPAQTDSEGHALRD